MEQPSTDGGDLDEDRSDPQCGRDELYDALGHQRIQLRRFFGGDPGRYERLPPHGLSSRRADRSLSLGDPGDERNGFGGSGNARSMRRGRIARHSSGRSAGGGNHHAESICDGGRQTSGSDGWKLYVCGRGRIYLYLRSDGGRETRRFRAEGGALLYGGRGESYLFQPRVRNGRTSSADRL